MTDIMEKQRLAFEKHTREICIRTGFNNKEALFRKPNGNYKDERVYAAWEGWKGAIAALSNEELDEKAFTKALDSWWITKSTTNADNAECLGDAIREYLTALKEGNE